MLLDALGVAVVALGCGDGVVTPNEWVSAYTSLGVCNPFMILRLVLLHE